jgi:hypothetical protein
MVRVPGCRSRGLGFDFKRYQFFLVVVGLEWDPLSFVRINEELLRKEYRLRSRKPRLTAVTPLYPQMLPIHFAA